MPNFISRNGEDIFLNVEEFDSDGSGSNEFSPNVAKALDLIRSISVNQQPPPGYHAAVDTIFDEAICLSPYTIFRTPIHRDICHAFNEISPFGCTLRVELATAGAFDFLNNIKSRTAAESIVERILSVFSISAAGLSDVSDAPLDFIHAVVDVFRSSDGLAWNLDLLGKGPLAVQCVSNVINALSKIYDDTSLFDKARKHRSPPLSGRHRSWQFFQHSQDIVDQELLTFFEHFIEDSRMRPATAHKAVMDLAEWMRVAHPGRSVRDVVGSGNRKETFSAFLSRRAGGENTKSILASVEASEKLSVSILEQIANEGSDGAKLFPLISSTEITRLKRNIPKSSKSAVTRARALPEKLIPIAREILEEGEEGWPGQKFRVRLRIDGCVQSVYCPVIPTLFLAMLDLPLRMGQLRRLDSGEGDLTQFNADTMEWEPNTGPLAGYWCNLYGEDPSNSRTRGYAVQINDDVKIITGIFVNTNKTGEPHDMPFFVPYVQRLFWKLRKWQEKYNPISAPIGPENYLDVPRTYPEATKAALPLIFPISRLFPNKRRPMQGRTVTHSEIDHAWHWILYEIERRWNERHPTNSIKLVELNARTRQPQSPRYTIHGIRKRGLTHMYRCGMPLPLLSRHLAGHATVDMTIRYVDPPPSEVAEIYEAAVANSSAAQRSFIDDLKALDIEEARRRTVSVSPSAVDAAFETDSQFTFCNVGIGVCPYDGSRCSDGGQILQKAGPGKASVYGPVKPRNCVVCRHFLSGAPWLNQLADYGTKLLESDQHLRREEVRVSELAAQAEEEHQSGRISDADFENRWDELGADIQKIRDEREAVETAIFNTEVLCTAITKIMDTYPAESGLLLVSNDRARVEYRETTEFRRALRITKSGRVHHVLGEERVTQKLNDYLDMMMFNSGLISPRLNSKITPDHRRKAMDQFALFIEINASDTEIDGLASGSITLGELKLEQKARELIAEAVSEPALLADVTLRQETRRALGGPA